MLIAVSSLGRKEEVLDLIYYSLFSEVMLKWISGWTSAEISCWLVSFKFLNNVYWLEMCFRHGAIWVVYQSYQPLKWKTQFCLKTSHIHRFCLDYFIGKMVLMHYNFVYYLNTCKIHLLCCIYVWCVYVVLCAMACDVKVTGWLWGVSSSTILCF